MLKNIRLHIEKDEQKQALLDATLASHIVTTHNSNINAFQRNIPSLLPYVQTTDLANYSVFINKYGENNIIDYGMGRTFYGFHPEEEVLQQLARIEQHCPEVIFQTPLLPALTPAPSPAPSPAPAPALKSTNVSDSPTTLSFEELESVKLRNQQPPMPYEIECLVVLGCGLGIHLSHLLKHHKIKNLLIYEPELQYFQCSVMTTSWQEIFTLAKKHDTAIFLQLEKDGRDLLQDINELIEHSAISSFHIYKHYNHEVFDSVHKDLSERTWSEIENSGFKIKSKESYLDYLPKWTPNVDLATHSLLGAPNDRLANNLKAFKRFFPEIYKEYKNYTPKKWLPVSNSQGEVNLVKIDSLHSWYGESPKQDCTLNFENFNEQPNKDGLVLGYRGTKLAHYIHYQFVKETEELLKQAEEEVGALPNKVPSIIMFGLGVGYQLEKLLDEHTVEKLFICEPNPDFFYASLFAIDWQHIFETVETSESRIYLNIGDDGTNLFRDLLNQFYAIGPYILNSTYFYQSYYNASLNSAISQLREQLQVVISMGEYFDHAYYGIAHTKEGMRRKIPILAANPASKLSYDDKEVPIFIVGNGPSLDHSIETIKEWQGQAIVVSCGTTLQALHRHGITPDFHAEIEQNRSTFDWAVLIGDLEYLKNITLISCNGIHPDTCDLYKDVLIAFKEGESSTVSALNVLGRKNFTTLLNAFPTVSNFAIDIFSTIGFTSIYLIGVDLGFVDVKHHHSKSSGYYQADGKETYDFTKSANTSLIVPGNFRPRVNTKHEFKVSRQVIEQVTSAKPKGQDFYNCSDGAKIQGTLPIRPDELLIVVTELQKAQAIDKLKTSIFSIEHLGDFLEKFEKMYSQKLLMKELDAFEMLLAKEITSKEDVENIINTQKEMLFASYKNGKSLLFYYLYGTVNYANALIIKLHPADYVPLNDKTLFDIWFETLIKVQNKLKVEFSILDSSEFSKHDREQVLLTQYLKGKTLLIVTNSLSFAKSSAWLISNQLHIISNVTISCNEKVDNNKSYDYIVYDCQDNKKLIPKKLGNQNTLFIVDDNIQDITESQTNQAMLFLVPHQLIDSEGVIINNFTIANAAILACLNQKANAVVIPRVNTLENMDLDLAAIYMNNQLIPADPLAIIFTYYSVITNSNHANLHCLSKNGTRGKLVEKLTDETIYAKTAVSQAIFYEAYGKHEVRVPQLYSDTVFESQIIVNRK